MVRVFDVKPGPLEGSNGLMLSLGRGVNMFDVKPEPSKCFMLSLGSWSDRNV